MENTFICNKCFGTAINQRVKKPFYLTQCGHIYCVGCIKQAEKECPQCQQTNVFTVELQKPFVSKVEEFFVPLGESLATLNRVYNFQNNQTNIMIKRFHEIDKKYDTLKLNYYKLVQDANKLKQKYQNLQTEMSAMKKKLLAQNMQNRTMDSNTTTSTTPVNSIKSRSTQMRDTTTSRATSSYFSCGNSTRSTESALARDFNEFRIPGNPDCRSVDSRRLSKMDEIPSERSSVVNTRSRIAEPRSAGSRGIAAILSSSSDRSSDKKSRLHSPDRRLAQLASFRRIISDRSGQSLDSSARFGH